MSFNVSGYLSIQKRCLFMHVNIFKVKRIAADSILFHLPNKKCILSVDTNLNNKQKIFHFQDYPQSIQYCPKEGKNYVLGGCINGIIQAQQYQQGKLQFKLGAKEQLQDQQNYINDLKYLGNGRLANCYNNGTIAIWDIEKEERILRMRQVHKRFTYKLRTFEQRLVSCGNDGYTVVTDLQECQSIARLKHQQAVWCANPWSYNEIITVGLFGQVKLWDLRSNRVVQFCKLLGGQTSFVTKFNLNEVILGDQQTLVKCDLRKFQRQEVANSPMVLSAQGIQILEDGAIICGRGFQICRFNKQVQMADYSQGQVIWNPFGLTVQSLIPPQVQGDQLQPEQENFIQEHQALAIQEYQEYQQQQIGFNQQRQQAQSDQQSQSDESKPRSQNICLNSQNQKQSERMEEQENFEKQVNNSMQEQSQSIEKQLNQVNQQQSQEINNQVPEQQQEE